MLSAPYEHTPLLILSLIFFSKIEFVMYFTFCPRKFMLCPCIDLLSPPLPLIRLVSLDPCPWVLSRWHLQCPTCSPKVWRQWANLISDIPSQHQIHHQTLRSSSIPNPVSLQIYWHNCFGTEYSQYIVGWLCQHQGCSISSGVFSRIKH